MKKQIDVIEQDTCSLRPSSSSMSCRSYSQDLVLMVLWLWIRTYAWMTVMVQIVMIQEIYLTSTATLNLKTHLVRILTLWQLQPEIQLWITTLPALVKLVRSVQEATTHQLRSHKKGRVVLQGPLMNSLLL